MTDQERDKLEVRLQSIEASQRRIEEALTGSKLGGLGIADRITKLEHDVLQHDKKLLKWGTAFAVIIVLVEILVVWGPRLSPIDSGSF